MFLSVDLSKAGYVVKNDAVRKDVYNATTKDIEDKIPDITNIATNVSLNAENGVKGEIPSITNLPTNTSLNVQMDEIKKKTT